MRVNMVTFFSTFARFNVQIAPLRVHKKLKTKYSKLKLYGSLNVLTLTSNLHSFRKKKQKVESGLKPLSSYENHMLKNCNKHTNCVGWLKCNGQEQ